MFVTISRSFLCAGAVDRAKGWPYSGSGMKQTLQRKRPRQKPTATLVPYIYRVTVEPDENRFHAEAPALPGCYSWGYTYEEALRNIKEAIELWLEVKKESGEPIPTEKPAAIRNAALTVGVLV